MADGAGCFMYVLRHISLFVPTRQQRLSISWDRYVEDRQSASAAIASQRCAWTSKQNSTVGFVGEQIEREKTENCLPFNLVAVLSDGARIVSLPAGISLYSGMTINA